MLFLSFFFRYIARAGSAESGVIPVLGRRPRPRASASPRRTKTSMRCIGCRGPATQQPPQRFAAARARSRTVYEKTGVCAVRAVARSRSTAARPPRSSLGISRLFMKIGGTAGRTMSDRRHTCVRGQKERDAGQLRRRRRG